MIEPITDGQLSSWKKLLEFRNKESSKYGMDLALIARIEAQNKRIAELEIAIWSDEDDLAEVSHFEKAISKSASQFKNSNIKNNRKFTTVIGMGAGTGGEPLEDYEIRLGGAEDYISINKEGELKIIGKTKKIAKALRWLNPYTRSSDT